MSNGRNLNNLLNPNNNTSFNISLNAYNCYTGSGIGQYLSNGTTPVWNNTNTLVSPGSSNTVIAPAGAPVRLTNGAIDSGVYYTATESSALPPTVYFRNDGLISIQGCDLASTIVNQIVIVNALTETVTLAILNAEVDTPPAYTNGTQIAPGESQRISLGQPELVIAMWQNIPKLGAPAEATLIVNDLRRPVDQYSNITDKGIEYDGFNTYTIVNYPVVSNDKVRLAGRPIWFWLAATLIIILFIWILLSMILHTSAHENTRYNTC